jgi:ATP-binding cassette, subfamily F, member 3
MISAQGLSKAYGAQILFEDASFTVNKGERVGLVGRNGHGKTTLFRLIVGAESPDEGMITTPRGYRLGYVKQETDFRSATVIEEACRGLPEAEYGAAWKAEKILTGLGFSDHDFSRSITEFSGGYQMRLSLAKVLVSEPDMLLLDEPTNFLDIVSIRWLEKFLAAWRSECIVISHDRSFMDRVVTDVMGIHRHRVRKFSGSTRHYYDQLSLEEEVYERERINIEKKQKQMKEFISKFRAKARQANLVQSRIKALEKMESKETLRGVETLSFSFPCADVPPKTLIRTDEITFGYDRSKEPLIVDLSIDIDKGDKICIIGKNGRGKTTLVKIMAEELKADSGRVKVHPHAKIAYYEQAHTADLNPDNTVEDEMMNVSEPGEAQSVRNVCGAMMFSGDVSKKKIKVLSGGEKCRVLLGKLLVSRHNILLLDEPTHHLDMESTDALIDAARRFEGAVIIVTHDERFLHNVASKLIVFQHGRVEVFPGTYQEFLEQVGWEDESEDRRAPIQKEKNKARPDRTKKSRKERAQRREEKARTLKPYEKKISDLEKVLQRKEKVKKELHEAMLAAVSDQKSAEIQTLSIDIHTNQNDIDTLYTEWEKAQKEYESIAREWE